MSYSFVKSSAGKSLSGARIAMLVANGFDENDVNSIQRALLDAGAQTRLLSPESGLVHSWSGDGWGHHYPMDELLSAALGADFSMLVIPGGSRSMDKLRQTAHTRRFIGSLMADDKPVAVCSDALRIMIDTDMLRGRTITGPSAFQADAHAAGAIWAENAWHLDGNLLTSMPSADEAARKAFGRAVVDFFTASGTMTKAA